MTAAAQIAAALGRAQRLPDGGFLVPCPCPGHGQGRGDRNPSLSIKDGDKGLLVRCFSGCDPRDVLVELRRRGLVAGDHGEQPPQNPAPRRPPEQTDEQRSQSALKLFDEAAPLIGSIGEAYLARRSIDIGAIELPDLHAVIRFHCNCPFGPGQRAPCVIALYRDIQTDRPVAIQRIAIGQNLDKLGRKALGPVGGAAMKLWPDEWIEQGLCVAEGLETALAAAMIEHRGTLLRPTWALGSAGAIRVLPVLASIEALTILVDHDAGGAGQDAASECARRWTAAGRGVVRLIPCERGLDFNTIIIEGNAA